MTASPRASAEQEAMSLYDDMATKRAWGTKEDAIRYLATALRTARSRAFEEAAKIAEERIAVQRQIPCPDEQPGCCVYHTTPGTRYRTPDEIATTLRRKAGEKET